MRMVGNRIKRKEKSTFFYPLKRNFVFVLSKPFLET